MFKTAVTYTIILREWGDRLRPWEHVCKGGLVVKAREAFIRSGENVIVILGLKQCSGG